MKKLSCLAIFILTILFHQASAQVADSVLTFQQAKARLLSKNFFLLAAYYQINQAEAQLIQARIWSNPNVNWMQEAYSIEQEKYFRSANQFEAQITQSISIAGKHTNTVKLAKINIELSKAQFEDVIRGLLFELGSTYNDLAGVEEKEKLYDEVLKNYEQLQATTKKELQVGAISVSEDLRIQSEYIAVKADALDNYNRQEELQAQIRTLLQYPKETIVRIEQRIPTFNASFVLDTLVNQSLALRPDIKFSKLYREFQDRNLKLQRSASIPDVTIGFDYDKGGNYTRNYSGLIIQMPLPLFDRNQGKIQEAQFRIKQSSLQFDYMKTNATNQVVAAYHQYQKNYDALSGYTDEYMDKLKQLHLNTNLFFQKRNISLLEFIDYQRVYISTQIQMIELRQQYLNSINRLNFSLGTQLIEY